MTVPGPTAGDLGTAGPGSARGARPRRSKRRGQASHRGAARQWALPTATRSAWNSLNSDGSEGRCASRNARVSS